MNCFFALFILGFLPCSLKSLTFESVFKPLSSFIGVHNSEVYDLVTKKRYRMPSPADCPEIIYNIMTSCWSAEPEDRPTFEVLKHELNWYQDSICSYSGKPKKSWGLKVLETKTRLAMNNCNRQMQCKIIFELSLLD